MGKLEDYVNSLDGKDNLDVTEVVGEMFKLHKEDIGTLNDTANARIAELNDNLTTKDATIAEKDSALTKQMAANWKLMHETPINNPGADIQDQANADGKPDAARISLDDMFE